MDFTQTNEHHQRYPQFTQIDYFSYGLILYGMVILYVIPYTWQIPHAKMFLPLLTLALIFLLLQRRRKVLLVDIILSCAAILASCFNYSSYVFLRHTLPICLMSIGFSSIRQLQIKRSYLLALCWLSMICMSYQMTVYRRVEFEGSTRVTLSVGDPNSSGLYMLLFFFLCYKIRFIPGIIFAIVSSGLFLSRNYMIALILFGAILAVEKLAPKLVDLITRVGFFPLFTIANAFGIWVGEFYINNVEVGFAYETGSSRLFSFNDQSNLIRFLANDFLLKSYSSNLRTAIRGYGEDYEAVFRPIKAIIHNSFLEVLAYAGILIGIVYFCILVRTIGNYYTRTNVKYIIPYVFFGLFLHSGYQGVTPYIFLTTLALAPYRKERHVSPPESFELRNGYRPVKDMTLL